jgi:hypothetical protein
MAFELLCKQLVSHVFYVMDGAVARNQPWLKYLMYLFTCVGYKSHINGSGAGRGTSAPDGNSSGPSRQEEYRWATGRRPSGAVSSAGPAMPFPDRNPLPPELKTSKVVLLA